MRIFLCLVLPLFLLSGCFKTSESESSSEAAPTLNLLGWYFFAKIKTTYVSDSDIVPTDVYVFPALRLGRNGQPIDALSHRVDDRGELQWFSAAPRAGEVQSVIEKKLITKGFRVISFQDLMNFPKAHSVLVFNPYFMEARWSDGDAGKGVPEGWSTFARLTASTFPMDLDPVGKRDILQQELVSLFQKQSNAPDVVKRSLVYLIDHIGQNKEWSESISLLK
jgi:hypothetical protein